MRRLVGKSFLTLGVILLLVWLAVTRPFVIGSSKQMSTSLVDPRSLKFYVEKISREFSPRDWKHTNNLDKIANFLVDEFKKTNSTVSLQTFLVAGKQYSNVISDYGPPGGSGVIIIGAHYDACDEHPAADDNASGVAGLLELGKLLSKQDLPINIRLVAYTLEEPPFFRSKNMGSAIHAASLVASGEKVRLMISLEMIGYFSEIAGSQTYPVPLLNVIYPSRGDFIAVVGRMNFSRATIDLKRAFSQSVALPIRTMNAPTLVPGLDYSDHLNYWNNNFDAVMITDTAFFRNFEYHRQGDTPDRLNYDKMGEVVVGVYNYLMNAAKET